jgi:hypothetical protein
LETLHYCIPEHAGRNEVNSRTATIPVHLTNSAVDQMPDNLIKSTVAGVAELVDARDLKSLVPKERAGSSPASGTNIEYIIMSGRQT